MQNTYNFNQNILRVSKYTENFTIKENDNVFYWDMKKKFI